MRIGLGWLLSGTNYAEKRLEEMAEDWQVDESGERYRRIGNSIEHEPVMVHNGVEIPYSQFYKKGESDGIPEDLL